MKKIALYTMMLLTLGFTACDEDFNGDVAAPQTNPQEDAQSVDGFTVAKANGFSTLVLTEDMLTENAPITAFSITATPTLPEGGTATLRLQADKTKDFANAQDLACKNVENNEVTVLPADLNTIVKALYGKAPNARDLYLRAFIYINDGTSASMVPTPLDFGPIVVTPVAPVIEKAYYLYGAPTGWSKDDLLAFSHSSQDVYEDPVFTITFPAVKDDEGQVVDCWFKIASQSSVDAQQNGGDLESVGILGVAVNGDESFEGKLVSENPQALKIAAGDYQYVTITLDMMESTYKIELLTMSPYMYVPGDYQGWAPATASYVYSTDLQNYSAFVPLKGSFKITSERTWDGTNYGNGGDGTLSTDGGAGNLSVDEEGFYFLTANVIDMTWKATLISTMGLIGDATAGSWDTSTPMDFDMTTSTYTVVATLNQGGFKFRANDGWAISLGGDITNLTTANGANIDVAPGAVIEPGTYKITLSLAKADKYTATFEKQ